MEKPAKRDITIVNDDLISHDSEPLKGDSSGSKDSFRYRGTMEETVTPIAPFVVSEDESDDDHFSFRDYTAG
ncbi:hypothetical protein [Candidatus Chlorohelix sp.]|uniref:hypothetical protein n=1 Tax=Candidatus Chlorohelix sp. TaxID=3139201 RepID=UPI0030690C98